MESTTMIGRFLCMLGFHSWTIRERYYPYFEATVITKIETTCMCSRCGRVERSSMEFDPITGKPIEQED